MEGSLNQLKASNYLINSKKPATSFFNHNYNNYSNFVRDTRRKPFSGDLNFNKTIFFKINEDGRHGDHITSLILEFDLPDLSNILSTTGKKIGYCNGIGNALIKEVSFEINGNLIDRQTPEWMDIWSQLSIKPGLQENYKKMIKKFDSHDYSSFQGGKVYVPLHFWFSHPNYSNDNSSMVLPIFLLHSNEIQLKIKLNKFEDLIVIEDNDNSQPTEFPSIESIFLGIDYVTLNSNERQIFLNQPKHYNLIYQVQNTFFNVLANETAKSFSIRSFKYPISELIWVFKSDESETHKKYFNYGSTLASNTTNPIETVTLTFEGKERFEKLPANYFTDIEPFKVHDNVPNSFIHCYSFALRPEYSSQPSGVCNFSEIQDIDLHFTFKSGLGNGKLYIFGINYNVLQIDEKGNSCLLHNLSKSVPEKLPTIENLEILEKKRKTEELELRHISNNTF